MSKEVVHQYLFYAFIVGYILLFLFCVFSWWVEEKEEDKINSAGCAVIMVVTPIILGAIWWYISLPDKLLR